MKDRPLVSVIVPCYNQAQYLAETLDSVLSQTYSKWECIIINDGSIDNSANIAKGYCEKDHRFKFFSQNNSGVCITRNNGIRNSTGKYILPLDGDDKIAPSYIDKAVNILEINVNVKVVTCIVRFFGKKKTLYNLPACSLERLMGQNTLICTSMFRRSDYNETVGFNANMREGLEDWDFWLSLLESGGEVFRIEEVLFFYRIRHGSRTTSLTLPDQEKLRKQIYENHRKLYSKYFFNPLWSFEYQNIINSKEYRVGRFLLAPVRKVLNFIF